ncbi:two-component sensor histidine kinase [Streptomyces chrestomyceticus JCM 4735]|uniref:histidine kinase n=1 Tax=Streptomyces chrestomyceticus JCM 4735 TaxID=1306181 RepID=A0A7U9KWW1_9ACTN|nr:HAMP domain-containing sensor histidine kinase [Streptomyces chrestomyceticus]GCD36866.1 two-component sensor histidine kinase [Streptomyces chrestomyceticus JCM 4735]
MRGRTAAAAALAMGLVLAVGGGWLYALLRANLLDNTTSRTEVAARKVAAQADTGALPDVLPSPADGVDLVLVLDATGRVVATSLRTADPLAAELRGLRPSPGQDSADRVLTGSPAAAAGGARADVVVVRASPPGGSGQERYVYAVTVLSDVDDATHAIGVALLASAPPLIALAAAIAWAVTGLALRPVTAIRTELAAVSESELDRRVPDPAGGDEIALMARTVNATLDRLEQAVTRQRQFVADASHELRNPIAAVRSRLEVALAGRGGGCGGEHEESVRAALRDTERLQRIAADLLLLARLDAHAPRGAEPVDLALLAAEEAARRPGGGGPRLVVEAGEPVPVRGDPAQLERLLTNLVDNALRYAASEVRLVAWGDPGAGQAVLEVVDDGPGVPEADRGKVFERFARLDAARGRETGGTGLGLAIARGIARAHGGELTVRGREDGRAGARFVVVLPVPAVEGAAGVGRHS